MKKFVVFYLPFQTSDLESEMVLYAEDEEDAREVFERLDPQWCFIRAEAA
jgi:hypothetical protein